MKRPSQFMLAFLVLVGTPLFLLGEKPTPVKLEQMPVPRLLDRGKQPPLPTAKKQKAPATRPDTATIGRGPWTVFGTITGEATGGSRAANEAAFAGIGLELVPVGAGRNLGSTLSTMIVGPNGSYSWAGLVPGAYQLRARPEVQSGSAACSHLGIAVDVELPDVGKVDGGEHRFRQDVLLPLARTLKGSILSASRKPRSGVTVSVSETGVLRGTAVSGRDGTFEIERVGRGPYEVELRSDDGKALPVDGIETATDEDGDPRIEVAVLR